jgi:hypothetical protein
LYVGIVIHFDGFVSNQSRRQLITSTRPNGEPWLKKLS